MTGADDDDRTIPASGADDATVVVAKESLNAVADETVVAVPMQSVSADATVAVARPGNARAGVLPERQIPAAPGAGGPAATQHSRGHVRQVTPPVSSELVRIALPATGEVAGKSVLRAFKRRIAFGWLGFVGCCLLSVCGVVVLVRAIAAG